MRFKICCLAKLVISREGAVEHLGWLAIIDHDDSSGRKQRPNVVECIDSRLVKVNIYNAKTDRLGKDILLYVATYCEDSFASIELQGILERLKTIDAKAIVILGFLVTLRPLERNIFPGESTESIQAVVIFGNPGIVHVPVEEAGRCSRRAANFIDIPWDISSIVYALHEKCQLIRGEVVEKAVVEIAA